MHLNVLPVAAIFLAELVVYAPLLAADNEAVCCSAARLL
jgi:hypothetical protein